MTITNNNPVPINFYSANQIWTKDDPARQVFAMRFDSSGWVMKYDSVPDTLWSPAAPVQLGAGAVGQYIGLFLPRNAPLTGLTSADLEFDDGCIKGVSVDIPTPTLTPTPDCNLYTLSEFDFHNSHQQEIMVSNGDPWNDTKVTRIRFDWTYFEQKVVGTAWEDIFVDWFTWNGASAWGGGDGNAIDTLSWTDSSSDSPSSWTGPLQFNHGNSYALRIDFDGAPGGGSVIGVTAEDFGLIIDFENGCQLSQESIQKGVVTWTPTATPVPSDTPTPTVTGTSTNTPPPTATSLPSVTPTPDCSGYTLGDFQFRDSQQIRARFRNGDAVDTELTSLELIWDYAEQYGAANGYNNFNVDFFKWAGTFFPGMGNGGSDDKSSSTTWNGGTMPFVAGERYWWLIDFDKGWASPLTGLVSSDFGVRANFANGCTYERTAIPRSIVIWTPTQEPTSTPTTGFTPLSTSTPPPPTSTLTKTPSNTPTPGTPTNTPTEVPTNTPFPTFDPDA